MQAQCQVGKMRSRTVRDLWFVIELSIHLIPETDHNELCLTETHEIIPSKEFKDGHGGTYLSCQLSGGGVRGLGVQGHPWLHRESEVSLGCRRLHRAGGGATSDSVPCPLGRLAFYSSKFSHFLRCQNRMSLCGHLAWFLHIREGEAEDPRRGGTCLGHMSKPRLKLSSWDPQTKYLFFGGAHPIAWKR